MLYRQPFVVPYPISKSIVSLLPSPCRATALSAARRLDTIDLEMELLAAHSSRAMAISSPERLVWSQTHRTISG